jgi:hypothetical protein
MAEQYGHYRPHPNYEALPFAGVGAAYPTSIGTLAAVL